MLIGLFCHFGANGGSLFPLAFLLLSFYFCEKLFSKMNKRLLQFLAAENITQTQLAETLDVAKA
ncbi:MAG: hypothetical protein LIQ26_06345, partial [Bacteroidota bacterium]|nr:hypothetical protein [Bacteroidota bacterium]